MGKDKVIIELSTYEELLSFKKKIINNKNIYYHNVSYLGASNTSWIFGDDVVKRLKNDNRELVKKIKELTDRNLIQRIINK